MSTKFEFITFSLSTLIPPVVYILGGFSAFAALFVSFDDMNNFIIAFFIFIALGALFIGLYQLIEQFRFKNRSNGLIVTDQFLIMEGVFTNNWKIPQIKIEMSRIEEIELIDERTAPHPREELILKMKDSSTRRIFFLGVKKKGDFSIEDIAKEISQHL